jgi:hypothetical protein
MGRRHIGQDRGGFGQDQIAVLQYRNGARRVDPQEGGGAMLGPRMEVHRAQVKPRTDQRGQEPHLVAIRAEDVVVKDHAATSCAP